MRLLLLLALVFLPCTSLQASSHEEGKAPQADEKTIASFTLELASLLTKKAESLEEQTRFPQADEERITFLTSELKSLHKKRADRKKAQPLRDLGKPLKEPSGSTEEMLTTLQAVENNLQDGVPGGLPEDGAAGELVEASQSGYIPLINNPNGDAWLEIEKPFFRFIQPKLRFSFDTGSDDDNEADLSKDGAADLTLNLLEMRFNLPKLIPDQLDNDVTFGPTFGFGAGTRPGDSGVGTEGALRPPALLLSAGMKLEYTSKNLPEDPLFGIEFRYAQGWNADESYDYDAMDDGALYFGIMGRFW